MKDKGTTRIGNVNRNGHEVVRATDLPGNDYLQRIYVLRCLRCRCGHEYGADVRALLDGHVSQARQMLRKPLDGTMLTLEPVVVNGERRYVFNGSGNYLRLLPADLARTVVAPTGFEPVFQP